VLIVTTNELAGAEILESLGEVFGVTVRSRSAAAQLGAGLRSLVGGELRALTRALEDSRIEALDRLATAAAEQGADAVVGMRFDTCELGGVWTEVCAYGTAVRTVPSPPGAR
jgi:uncharacterized protein YbjQ (UPF0145 family)